MAPREVIIDGVVYGMSNTITELNVREGVTSIPDDCCLGCVLLTTVILPSSLLSIGQYAFHGCESLRKITLPKSLSSIGRCCFWGCSKLESIVFPNSVTTFGDSALAHCTSLSEVILPNSLTAIPCNTFSHCNSLKSLVTPDSETSIGMSAFSDCIGLTSINIPDNATVATESDWHSFRGCTELEEISASNNMKVEDYFRTSHLKKLHDEKIKPRVIVLLCYGILLKDEINLRELRDASQVVKVLREEFDNKIDAINEEKDKNINAQRIENEELREENEALKNKGKSKVEIKKVDRNEKHLNGRLAFEKVTALELWRQIIMYL